MTALGRKRAFGFELRLIPFVRYLNTSFIICHNKNMVHYIFRFVIIALLFGSVDAVVDAVHIDSEHNQGPGHLIHDHDESNSNVDDQRDSCDHYCHCTAQLGMIFSYFTNTPQTCTISKIPNYHRFHSRPLPHLFCPPII